MIKKTYETPEIIVKMFNSDNIIETSGGLIVESAPDSIPGASTDKWGPLI